MDSANMAGKDVSTVQNVLLARAEGEEMKTCVKCHKTLPLTDQFFGIPLMVFGMTAKCVSKKDGMIGT
jgi:hypothetical protein